MTRQPSHARTALKFGLRALDLKRGDSVLLPDYLCEAVIQPLEELGLHCIFFPINDDFSPVWNVVRDLVDKRTRALLMVHYFGQPQSVNLYREIAEKNNLLLIEDNAHGHGGMLDGKKLGEFGDIGISSPRKILGTTTGGILYRDGQISTAWDRGEKRDLSRPIAHWMKECLKRIFSPVRNFVDLPKKPMWKCPDYSDPFLFRDVRIGDWEMDWISARRIQSTDWARVGYERRDKWQLWGDFVSARGLSPIWKEPHPKSCPWIMPAYAENLSERNRWLRWGRERNHDLFPWPSLPKLIVDQNGSALRRWERLICFPLD